MTGMKYRAVPEETVYIDVPGSDSLKIKALLRGSLDGPVVVMLHGLPSSANDLLHYLGARYLYEQGFSSLRVYLYYWEDNTRNLADCNLDTHVTDFDTAVSYLRDLGVRTVFAEGHSYGGLTIIKSKTKLEGAVLWDPSHGLSFRNRKIIKYYENANIKKIDGFKLFLNGSGYIEPDAITEEQDEMGDNSGWAANKGYPLKIISAGKGAMTELHKKYIASADTPAEQHVITGAHHSFEDSDEVMLELFEQTAEWFKGIKND